MTTIESMEPGKQSCWKTIGTMGDSSCEKLARHIHCRNCGTYSSAGRKLLDRQMSLDFAREWSDTLARPEEAKELDTFSVLVFRLRNDWLAIKTGCFAEAVQTRGIHVVPFRSGRVFRGLVNINGELLMCFSVTTLMGIEGEPPAERKQHAVYERMVVVNNKDVRFVFLVDEIDGVHHIRPDQVQKPPATFSRSQAVFTSGIFTFRDQTVGLLDDERLLSTLQESMNE
jgi:chemotaxis-related protein WspD